MTYKNGSSISTTKRRKWTELDDNAIRANNGYGDNKMLASRLHCSESQIVGRRKTIKERDRDEGRIVDPIQVRMVVPTNLSIEDLRDKEFRVSTMVRQVTARPSFFVEDLAKMARGRR